jgi:glycosyltransferase involved in cell wall biosynthesis
VVRNYQNFGKGWAIKTGYEFTTGDFILFLDSDLELSPYHIPNFFKIMIENNADVVIGSKIHKDSVLDYPLQRRIVSFVYYSIIKLFFGLPIMDSQTGIKLFRREALEKALPKVLVKKFAFDIELLIILHKSKWRILSAPIELKFSRGKFGNIRFSAFVKTFLDTMAVFYRDKILRFYNRPLGENKKFFYTIVLFPELYDKFEQSALKKFLSIPYDRYQVILAGRNSFNIRHRKLKFCFTEAESPVDRFAEVMKNRLLKGDFVVFSRLNAFPDERFLFNTGRILSLRGIGGAGGYVIMRNNHTPEEWIAFSVIRSFFLNLNMIFRFQPMNYHEVEELQLDGFFVKRELLNGLVLEGLGYLKLEYLLSKQIKKHRAKMVYSPDIMLYKKFPGSFGELMGYVEKEAGSRALQLKIKSYRPLQNFQDKKFVVSVVLLGFLLASAGAVAVFRNPFFLAPALVYYCVLLFTRLALFGLYRGWKSFIYLSAVQLVYGLQYLIYLFGFVKRTAPVKDRSRDK